MFVCKTCGYRQHMNAFKKERENKNKLARKSDVKKYMYEAVTATFDCCGHSFTAKGKRILSEGWREIDHIFRTSLKEKPVDGDGGTLPDFTEGQTFDGAEVSVTEHFTQPPKPYTEAICCERGIRNRP